MDDDIIESFHENHFQNEKEIVEDNYVENEIDQDLDANIHFSFPMFNEHIQQSCQFLSV
jgi:hypothetical protein